MHLHPDLAVVLNTDKDHLECYESEEQLFSAYLEFAGKLPRRPCAEKTNSPRTFPLPSRSGSVRK